MASSHLVYQQLLMLIAFGGILRFVSNRRLCKVERFWRDLLIEGAFIEKNKKKWDLYSRGAIKRRGHLFKALR